MVPGGVVGVEDVPSGSFLLLSARTTPRTIRAITRIAAIKNFGWAHGVEASPGAFWVFSAGFVAVSGLLLLAGYGAGRLLRRHPGLQKACGGGLLAGAALVLAG